MIAALLRFMRQTARQCVSSLALRNRTTGHSLVPRITSAVLAYVMLFTALPPLPAHAEWRVGLPPAVTTSALPARASTIASAHNLLRTLTPKAAAPLLLSDLFGPKIYTRGPGAPVTITDAFTLPAGAQSPFLLCVVNGAPDGTLRVSSASIKLNGQDVFRPRDFNQQVSTLSAAIEPSAANNLQARLMSAPGSYLTITLASDCHAPSNERPTAVLSYGNAIERLVAREITSNSLHKTLFQPVGGKGQPDFTGVGTASGVNLDITTAAQIQAHLARPGYGPGLQIVTYTRPSGFGGF